MNSIIEEFALYPYEGDAINEIRILSFKPVYFRQYRIGPLSVLLDVEGFCTSESKGEDSAFSSIGSDGAEYAQHETKSSCGPRKGTKLQEPKCSNVASRAFRMSVARHRVQDGDFPFSHKRDFEALGNIVLFDPNERDFAHTRTNTGFIEVSSPAFVEIRRLLRRPADLSINIRTYFPPRKPEPGITVGAVLRLTLLVKGQIACSFLLEGGSCRLAT